MSLLFFEGFETVGYALGLANQAITEPNISARWGDTNDGGVPAQDSFFLITDGFGEGYAVQMGENGFSNSNYLEWSLPEDYHSAPGPSSSELIIGWRVHIPSATRTFTMLRVTGLLNAVTDANTLFINVEDSTKLQCGNGAVSFGTESDIFEPDHWHYVEARFKIADSPDGYLEVYVDGVQVANYTSIDTNNWATHRAIDYIRFMTTTASISSGDYVGYDDIYILETSAAPYQTFLQPVRVRSLPPESDISLQWYNNTGSGSNYDKIDENGVDTADYIESETYNDLDKYEITDTDTDYQDDIYAVKVEAEAKSTRGAEPDLEIQLISGSSTETNEITVDNSGDYSVYSIISTEDPATASQWDTESIDSVILGIKYKQ